jgi:hypothetical protein
MNEPLDSGLPSMVRLKPRPLGRGLPVPPVLPIVAIVSILVGLAMGYGLAPRPEPATPPATPSTPASATASALAAQIAYPSLAQSLDPTLAPIQSTVSTLEIPPSGGLSLSQALEALGASFGPRSDVISARISRYPPVSSGWVWLIVVPYSALYCKDGPPLPAEPAVPAGPLAESVPLGDCRSITSTELVILDYQTGEFLEDRIPAG